MYIPIIINKKNKNRILKLTYLVEFLKSVYIVFCLWLQIHQIFKPFTRFSTIVFLKYNFKHRKKENDLLLPAVFTGKIIYTSKI